MRAENITSDGSVPLPPSRAPSPLLLLAMFLFVFAGYYGLSALSVWFAGSPSQASPVWLPDGFALGVLIAAMRRTDRWSVSLSILGAVLVANLTFGWATPYGWLYLSIGALANLFQVYASAAFVLRAFQPHVIMISRMGWFLAVVVVAINGVVAAVQTANAVYFHNAAFVTEFWTLFLSNALGLLLITPLIAAWTVHWTARDLRFFETRVPEIVLVLSGVIGSTWWAYARPPDAMGVTPPYFYFPLPFLVWGMLRFGSRGTTLSLLIHVLIGMYFTCRGQGPFVTGAISPATAALQFQEFMLVFVSAIFVTNATIRDRLFALREKLDVERRYNAALNASDNLIFEIENSTDRIVWAGDTDRVLGVTSAAIATTERWAARIHPDDRARVADLRSTLMQRGQSTAVLEYRVLFGSDTHTSDAQYITVGINAFAHESRLMGGINAERRLVGFMKNISERKVAAEEKLKLETALHQAQKMEAVGQLAGGIAHDFNNILASILGYGEMARAKVDPDSLLAKNLDAILKAGERGRVLVSQILTFSRKSPSEKQVVDVADLVDEVATLVRGSTPHPVELLQEAPRYAARVLGNATELHQLVMNLATNGVQAMPNVGTLRMMVTVRDVNAPLIVLQGQLAPGKYVVLSVSDQGVGVDEATRARMFEPFFTTKPQGKGVGLGLSLAMSIARAHGGGIDLVTGVGRGSMFTVYLPAATGEEARAVPKPPADVPRGQDERILIVDDEPPLRDLAQEMLASLGYQTASYPTSAEALAAFNANPQRFDAVLTDEVMPDISGTQLAMEIHKTAPHMPILIITGYGGPGFELRAQRAGVWRVLKKPYQQQEIAAALNEALRQKRAPDQSASYTDL
jgi:signal transduction histidine kinase/ActR/RegA family two-component response regulator